MKLFDFLERCFFPRRCPVCREIIPFSDERCGCCIGEEVKVPSDFNDSDLSDFTAVYLYSGETREKIARFKFRGEKALYREMSLSMSEKAAQTFSQIDFDFVTFVPAGKAALEERGYDQSELLARGVAERLFVPCEATLKRVKEVESQHTLSAKERYVNLKGVMALAENAEVKDKTILLCDDVKTTGTTLKSCRDELLKSGAKCVCLVTYAMSDYYK